MKWFLLSLLGLACSLTLHVVPHSRCELTGLKTFENSYSDHVESILDNALNLLSDNPEYKIVWSEIAFLRRWMMEQSSDKQRKVQTLIDSGQIEIVGGGYSQHDEASSDLEEVVRNIETGHKYLKEKFGNSRIKTAWQIDSFGHSALTPSILSKFGYDYMVGNNIDSEFKEQLFDSNNLEFIWKGSQLGGKSNIFAHILSEGYTTPGCGAEDKENCCFDDPEDPVVACADFFLKYAKEKRRNFRTDNILVLVGGSLAFQDYNSTREIFKTIIKSSEYIQEDYKYNGFEIKLSTISEYFQAVESSNERFHVYKGDFLPYQLSHEQTFKSFAGSFASNMDLKQKIRDLQRLSRATEIATSLILQVDHDAKESSFLIDHTVLSGVCKAEVKTDLLEKIDLQSELDYRTLEEIFSDILETKKHTFELLAKTYIVYNSLNWQKDQLVLIKSNSPYTEVLDWNLKPLKSQSIPNEVNFDIYVEISAPSLSIVTLFVTEYPKYCENCSEVSETSSDLTIETDLWTIYFNEDHMIDKIKTKTEEEWEMNQQLWKYEGNEAGIHRFSPVDEGSTIEDLAIDSFKVYKGSVVTVIHSEWNRSIKREQKYYQTVTIGKSPKINIKIGVYSEKNEEISVRFSNQKIQGDSWLYTGNGGDLRIRKYIENTAERLGNNMYPVPGGFSVNAQGLFLNVFPSYNSAVGMPSQDTFEMLLHRKIISDEECDIDYDDFSFAEHEFNLKIGIFNPKEYFKDYFDSKHPLIVMNVHEKNGEIARGNSETTEWPFMTYYTLGIQDENAFISSAAIRNDRQLLLRIFNFDSKLKWENAIFRQQMFCGGFDIYEEYVKFNGKKEFEFNKKPGSGLVPSNWTSFEFETLHAEINYNKINQQNNEYLYFPNEKEMTEIDRENSAIMKNLTISGTFEANNKTESNEDPMIYSDTNIYEEERIPVEKSENRDSDGNEDIKRNASDEEREENVHTFGQYSTEKNQDEGNRGFDYIEKEDQENIQDLERATDFAEEEADDRSKNQEKDTNLDNTLENQQKILEENLREESQITDEKEINGSFEVKIEEEIQGKDKDSDTMLEEANKDANEDFNMQIVEELFSEDEKKEKNYEKEEKLDNYQGKNKDEVQELEGTEEEENLFTHGISTERITESSGTLTFMEYSYTNLPQQSSDKEELKAFEYSLILILSMIFLGSICYYFRSKKRRTE